MLHQKISCHVQIFACLIFPKIFRIMAPTKLLNYKISLNVSIYDPIEFLIFGLTYEVGAQ
jgi:hypothetical protein